VAAALDLQLVDVTCSGATIPDLTGNQTASGTQVAPQFDAVTPDTRLVTLTIGGNDLGFADIAANCASLSGPDGPVRAGDGSSPSCEATYVRNGVDSLEQRIDGDVKRSLTTALATLKGLAPNATIVLVDYPAIAPDADHTPSGGCWTNPLQDDDALPFTNADLPYLQKTQQELNEMLQEVAGTAAVDNASDYTDSLAHTACASSDPWVHGVVIDGFSVAPRSLHPTQAGADALAQSVVTLVGPNFGLGVVAPTEGGVRLWVWVLLGVVVLALVVAIVVVVRRRRRPDVPGW
jgi:lysophospholipase L1-like esterase